MSLELSFNERRVLGVLAEKSLTTPEQYPLTLNSLVNGCNQKSCRDPVSYLGEDEVLDALDTLRSKQLITLVRSMGGRTDRYKHRFTDTLEIEGRKAAVLVELLLRGPQTDGELRQRASRMVTIPTLPDLAATLDELRDHGGVCYVRRLGPEGRRRGVKYAHTLYSPGESPGGEAETVDGEAAVAPTAPPPPTPGVAAEPWRAEPAAPAWSATAAPTAPAGPPAASAEVQELRARIERLEERVEELESTFMRFFQ